MVTQEFSRHVKPRHFVALGRVPYSMMDELHQLEDSGTCPGLQVWHPHFGRFDDQSSDIRFFLDNPLPNRREIPEERREAFLEAALDADDFTIVHAISGKNTLERFQQLDEFLTMLLSLKSKKYGCSLSDAVSLKPCVNVVVTKGYGDRNDRLFDEANPNSVSAQHFAYTLKTKGVSRLFFFEPHSYDAMQLMSDEMGEENVCFPTLSRGFSDYILGSEYLKGHFPDHIKRKLIAGGAPDGAGKWLNDGEPQASIVRGFMGIAHIHGEDDDPARLDLWRNDTFLQNSWVLIDKVREHGTGKTRSQFLHGNVEGKLVVAFDDVSASGGTLIEAAKLSYEHGADGFVACLGHPGFTRYNRDQRAQLGYNNALARILDLKRDDGETPLISRLFVGGTVPSFYRSMPQIVNGEQRPGVKIVDVASIVGDIVKNIHAGAARSDYPEVVSQMVLPRGGVPTFTR